MRNVALLFFAAFAWFFGAGVGFTSDAGALVLALALLFPPAFGFELSGSGLGRGIQSKGKSWKGEERRTGGIPANQLTANSYQI